MRKIIILKHGGGELANQLWNYVSIYAYGLEIGAEVKNPSFFEYHYSFNFLPKESLKTRFLSFFFKTPRRRTHFINRMGRIKYAVWVKIISLLNGSHIISSENTENKTVYIPPTNDLDAKYKEYSTLYFYGWLFRNPRGIEKFSKELHGLFKPNAEIHTRIENIIKPLQSQYKQIVGVHIRQSDYASFKKGAFVISEERVRDIINEYMHTQEINPLHTLFLIASDGPINQDIFKGLNIYVSKENSVTDLFLLSQTNIILGSDSSFGAFAAWYGNIPHIIFKNETIDWAYYKDKNSFFENKYTLLTQY